MSRKWRGRRGFCKRRIDTGRNVESSLGFTSFYNFISFDFAWLARLSKGIGWTVILKWPNCPALCHKALSDSWSLNKHGKWLILAWSKFVHVDPACHLKLKRCWKRHWVNDSKSCWSHKTIFFLWRSHKTKYLFHYIKINKIKDKRSLFFFFILCSISYLI